MVNANKTNWEQRVKDSKGKSFFIPEKLIPAVKEWYEKRKSHNEWIAKAARQQIETTVALENVIYSIRKHFSDNGHPDMWTTDVGFDTDALRDGQFIVNINENIPGQ